MLGVTACGDGCVDANCSATSANSGVSNGNSGGNSGDESGNSNTATPSALTIQSITKKADYKADVNWSSVTGASTYTVHQATASFTGKTASDYASLAGYKKYENLTGNTTEVTLDSNNVYHLIVTASNGTSQSAASAEKTASFTALALNDTSITKCGNYTSSNASNNEDCTKTADGNGAPIPAGQDGYYATGYKNASGEAQKGKNFTKVANGKCVQDAYTGLMWEVKQDSIGLHGRDNTYTWYNPDNTTNNGNAGKQGGGSCTGSACDTHAFVTAVNQAGWCGFKDWRLPTREELRTIVDYSKAKLTIDTNYFPNTTKNFYWSSSPYADGLNYAWGVNFSRGSVDNLNKTNSCRARLVRSR